MRGTPVRKRGHFATMLLATGIVLASNDGARSGELSRDDTSLVVALDRGVYRQRELYLLEDVASEAAASRSERVDVASMDGAVDVIIKDMQTDGELADAITNFGSKNKLSIATTTAESFSIDYTSSVISEFGVERLAKDASYLEDYVNELKPILPGVTITQDEHGAIVQSEDPEFGKTFIGETFIKKSGSAFIVTPLTATSWRVTWNASKKVSPAKRLWNESMTALALRELLGDPIDLEIYSDADGARFTVRDSEHHLPFITAVEAAFRANLSFNFRESKGVDIRLSKFNGGSRPTVDFTEASPPIPPPPQTSDSISNDSAELFGKLEGLINPPSDVRIVGDAVVVRAQDPARQKELSSLVRKDLAKRSDLVLKSSTDGTLQVELASGAHLGQKVPEITADRLIDAVKVRLMSTKITPVRVFALDERHIRVVFASAADRNAFKSSLSKAAGLTLRLVDEAPPGDSKTPPSAGDEKLKLPSGDDIWVSPSPLISGEMIADATIDRNKLLDQPVIEIRLTDEGRNLFAALTRDHIGQRLAIVVDKTALEAPVIREPITGGRVEISGNFTEDSAKALVQEILPHRDDLPLCVCAGK